MSIRKVSLNSFQLGFHAVSRKKERSFAVEICHSAQGTNDKSPGSKHYQKGGALATTRRKGVLVYRRRKGVLVYSSASLYRLLASTVYSLSLKGWGGTSVH